MAPHRLGPRVEDARAYVMKLVERAGASLPVRCLRRFVDINGRDRAFVLAGQAFTTVFPLLIIIGAAAGGNGTGLVVNGLTNRFNLSGSSAAALRTLFQRPPGATGTITVASAAVVLFSLVSLTRSLQRVFEQAWYLRPLGVRGTLHGLTGTALLLTSILLLSLLASVLRPLPAGQVLGLIVRMLLTAGIWLLLQNLLLSRRIPIRRLVPGALAGGLGQTAVAVYSSIWMPHLIGRNADRYGAVGVTFAILSWLIVVGLAVVILAVTSAELGGAPGPGRRNHPTQMAGAGADTGTFEGTE